MDAWRYGIDLLVFKFDITLICCALYKMVPQVESTHAVKSYLSFLGGNQTHTILFTHLDVSPVMNCFHF